MFLQLICIILFVAGLTFEERCSVWSASSSGDEGSDCSSQAVLQSRWLVTAAHDGATACTQILLLNCSSNFAHSFPSEVECSRACFSGEEEVH